MSRTISLLPASWVFLLLLTSSPAFAIDDCQPTACSNCPDAQEELKCAAQKYLFLYKCENTNPRQKSTCERKKLELLKGLKQLKGK